MTERAARSLAVKTVRPKYPPAAKLAGVDGDVVLAVLIARIGQVRNVEVISGKPVLVEAAKAAVFQWRFHKYLLNGRPVEIETQITIRFSLPRQHAKGNPVPQLFVCTYHRVA
jgi:periplasmic protein TonB